MPLQLLTHTQVHDPERGEQEQMRRDEEGGLQVQIEHKGRDQQADVDRGNQAISDVKNIFSTEPQRERPDVVLLVARHIGNVLEPGDNDAVNKNRGGEQPDNGRNLFLTVDERMKMQEQQQIHDQSAHR